MKAEIHKRIADNFSKIKLDEATACLTTGRRFGITRRGRSCMGSFG